MTGQTFDYAIPITCDINPWNVLALDLDTDEQYLVTTKPVLRATTTPFEPKKSSI